MKLCIVQSVLPIYAVSFFNRIVERNPDIDLVVLSDLGSKEALNQYKPENCRFRVAHLGQKKMLGITFRPKIWKVLRGVDADLVVFSGSPRELSQLLAMLWLRISGVPVAMWGMFHRIGGPRFSSSVFFRLVGSLADVCLCYTRIGAANLISLGVPKRKIAVVGTAIDEQAAIAEAALCTDEDVSQFRRQNGLEGNHVVLQVVRLNRIKQPQLLIQAASLLLKKYKDVIFVLVGDGEMREDLQAQVKELGLTEKFRFPGSIYDERHLSRWYLCARAFVVPTFIGLSAHHAMSYGVPVVTDDSLDCQGSEFDILAPGLNSLTYQEGNVKELADVLEKIITECDTYTLLSDNARFTVSNVHTLDVKTDRFCRNIRSLCLGSQA